MLYMYTDILQRHMHNVWVSYFPFPCLQKDPNKEIYLSSEYRWQQERKNEKQREWEDEGWHQLSFNSSRIMKTSTISAYICTSLLMNRPRKSFRGSTENRKQYFRLPHWCYPCMCVREKDIKRENVSKCVCENEKRELFKQIHIFRERREKDKKRYISYERECAHVCDFFLSRSSRPCLEISKLHW